MLDHSLGISPEPCIHRHGFLCVLFLFRVELRYWQFVCAGLQAADRLAGYLPALPVVEHRYGNVAAVRPLAEEHCAEQTAALRGKELRLHKRATDSQYGVRLNGKEKDDAHH